MWQAKKMSCLILRGELHVLNATFFDAHSNGWILCKAKQDLRADSYANNFFV